MGPAKTSGGSGGNGCLRCLGDSLWTVPFLSALWCVPLVLLLFYMRTYADDLWAVTEPMNVKNVDTYKMAWALGFWVVVGVNIGAFVVTLFSSGKLLEILVSQSCCQGSATRCLCSGFFLLVLFITYIATLLVVPILLALETLSAVLAMLILQTSVACGSLTPADLQTLVGLVSGELTSRVPTIPRFSLTEEQITPVCSALSSSTRSALIVVGLGFIAVLLQVLFSTSVFSRLWATRMEQKQVSLCRRANAAAAAASRNKGASLVGGGGGGGAGAYAAVAPSPKDGYDYGANGDGGESGGAGGVWHESKFGPIEEEAVGEVMALPVGGQRKGAFFDNNNRR